MATRKPKASTAKPQAQTGSYLHTDAKAIIRPEIGVQTYAAAKGKFKRSPAKYRYDDSLAPELAWDSQNPARERGEALIARLGDIQRALASAESSGPEGADARTRLLRELEATVKELQALSQPFLNWSGKAERLSFEVPTLPLFIHERLSTEAILETLKSHRASGQIDWLNDLFGNPERPVWEQLTKSYEHANGWSNRMVLGDSLVVMNSLLQFERMAGQVQMIYMDPPYGVKFGSNFQPFVRKRDVANNDDASLTREPEMVKAYRDTWELGLHSYLTYLRDRLLLARELLNDTGSIFVQISDENLHHVREVMDEVFGADSCISVIAFKKTTTASGDLLATVNDFLLWYAKDRSRVKFQQVFTLKDLEPDAVYKYVRLPSGVERAVTAEEAANPDLLPDGAKLFALDNLTSPRPAGAGDLKQFAYRGKTYSVTKGTFKTDERGLTALAAAERLGVSGSTLRYKRFLDDFAVKPIGNMWTDTSTGSFTESKVYAVQTGAKVVERCMLMTSSPGDLVLDPTCGSGTTAYVAEQWGRRWITMDTSRVPLALARQRLLTATFPFHELKDPARGPAGGFKFARKKNSKGEEVGGIVPRITLGSIANGDKPQDVVLVDRPEQVKGITRVTGRFVVEATIPTPQSLDDETPAAERRNPAEDESTARMIGILRASPLLHVGGGRTVKLASVREPSQSLTLSAEALVYADSLDAELAATDTANRAAAGELPLAGGSAGGQPVAILFGPENGALTEATVRAAHDEASMKSRGYTHLYVIGFAIDPRAREYLEHAAQLGVPATYVQATPDVLMGDLLKNMRSSQIFSVCGLPDVAVRPVPAPADAALGAKDLPYFEVTLAGLDVFDPATQAVDHRSGNDVPCWLLDTDYNGMVFHVNQAFFPRTAAWDNLQRSLKAEFDDSVWAHLSGNVSAPFTLGRHGKIAVKVIDDRGNELMVVKELQS